MSNTILKEETVTVEQLLAGAEKVGNLQNKKHNKQRKMQLFLKTLST